MPGRGGEKRRAGEAGFSFHLLHHQRPGFGMGVEGRGQGRGVGHYNQLGVADGVGDECGERRDQFRVEAGFGLI